LRISSLSSPSVSEVTFRWKAAGRRTAMTLIVNNELLSCVALKPKPCSENLVPPAKKHIPSTRSRLLSIDPTNEDCTICSSHFTKAMI
jgi:hypothetical protein